MQTDPTIDPSVFDKLYHSGAWVPLGILVAFFGLRAASTRWAWLKEDHRAAWVSALLGGLALLVVPATQGTTPNLSMIIGAIVTVTAIHADPKKTPAEQKQAQAGRVRLALMLVIVAIGGALLFSCSAKGALRDTIKATVVAADTAKAALPVYAHQHVEERIRNTTNANGGEVAMRADVAAFDAKVDKVQQEIAAVWRLAALAGVNLDDPSMANLATAATELHNDLKLIGLLK